LVFCHLNSPLDYRKFNTSTPLQEQVFESKSGIYQQWLFGDVTVNSTAARFYEKFFHSEDAGQSGCRCMLHAFRCAVYRATRKKIITRKGLTTAQGIGSHPSRLFPTLAFTVNPGASSPGSAQQYLDQR